MRLPLAAAFALLIAVASPGAFAQNTPPPSPPPGAEAPPPGPPPGRAGGITRDDYMKRAADRAGERFDRMDTDHDGILTRDEVRAYRASHQRNRRGQRGEAPDEPPGEAEPPMK